MPIQLTGSLDITGSILINGTAVTASGGGGGGSTFNPITNLYSLIDDPAANTVQTLDANAGGIFELHISASGLHAIDLSTIGATSASVNIYFHLDSFTTSGSQATWYVTLNSGSGNGFLYRTMVSSSGEYLAGGATIGGSNSTMAKNTTKPIYSIASGGTANPAIITVFSDGRKALGNAQTPIASSNNFISSGNQGTPIV